MKNAIVQNVTVLGAEFVQVTLVGETNALLLKTETVTGVINSQERTYGFPLGTFSPSVLIGANVKGQWENVESGETKVLPADHVLVTKGITGNPLDVTRNGKVITLSKGEKALVGDVVTYKQGKLVPSTLLEFQINSDAVMDEIKFAEIRLKLNKIARPTNDVANDVANLLSN